MDMDIEEKLEQSRSQFLKKSTSLDDDGLDRPMFSGDRTRTRALVGKLNEPNISAGRHRRRVSEDSRWGTKAPSSVTNFEDVIFVDMFDSSHLVTSPAERNDVSRISSKASSMFNIAFESGSNQQRHKLREKRLSMEVERRKSGSSTSLQRMLNQFDRQPTLKSRAWEWKRPTDEDSIQPVGALLYLAIIGWLTFAICFTVSFATDALDQRIRDLGFHSVVVLRAIAAVGAFLIPSYFSEYAIGSGIPELKCILSGSFLPHSLSPSTIGTRVVGLTLALVSGLSVGRLGPFMHIAAGIASTIAQLNIFPSLSSSAKYQVQAISAATAAGVGATLGSPVGGTLLSVELMSSYYFVHWLPMALYCSVMGYILAVSVIRMDEEPFFNTNVHAELHDSALSRLISYVVLGCVCGVVGQFLVKFTSSSVSRLSFSRHDFFFLGTTLG
uniref:Chloride channel protein n=1 Tax=Rhodosorus marinus TaxID=101924 RepID=A0A7S2ZBU6_9RHOD|mmetsp:Transcript_13639/g.54691  ORF Transcript_13639/g.54691 Transcript_13639/m.54691 type:complete len:442 (+) Transcript_13639:839-2164(+)